jgi:hypothetical protein
LKFEKSNRYEFGSTDVATNNEAPPSLEKGNSTETEKSIVSDSVADLTKPDERARQKDLSTARVTQ